MKHATCEPHTQRDHRIPLLVESLAKFPVKRHTLIRVRLRGLACAPRAPFSLQAFARGEAGRLFCTTGISSQSISTWSLSFPVSRLKLVSCVSHFT